MSNQTDLNEMCPVADSTSIGNRINGILLLVRELHDDHAAFKTVVDELTAWAETLGAKLNLDAGVTDADYDAVITADAPATLTATKPAAIEA